MSSAKLREYLTLANRLRHLHKIGRGDSDQADSVRGLMEDIWRGLSPEEATQADSATKDLVLTDDSNSDGNYLTD